MKKFLLSISLFLICDLAHGQTPELYGMTYAGGAHQCGTIFKINGDGSGFQTVYSFDSISGRNPYGSFLQASNGKLYGMTYYGGTQSSGTIFSFDPGNNVYTNLHSFNFTDGATPYGSLIQASNGKLYGMTSIGGTNNHGVLFSFDPGTNNYVKLFDLIDTLGSLPKGDLVQAANGKLYGLTSIGGKKGYGVLFSFDPVSNIYVKELDFVSANGKNPFGSLTVASNGKLYGTTRNGGDSNAGVVFSFNPEDNSYTQLYDFPGLDKKSPSAGVLALSGMLYGMTNQGGAYNFGSLYSLDTTGSIYIVDKDLDSTNGSSPSFNTLMRASNGLLYGMTTYGGTANTGVLFSMDTSGHSYTKLLDFTGANGKYPNGTLLQIGLTTGIPNEGENSTLLYPNPVKDQLLIDNGELTIKEINIYNVLGKGVAFHSSPLTRHSSLVDVSSQPAGIYYIQLNSGRSTRWLKMEKE